MKNSLSIIINSDDFGISNSVNKAIVSSFEQGLISSTTLMANMPGFEDAANQATTNPVLKNKIGLHLNLTEGLPLTDLIKTCNRFCNSDGYFSYTRKESIFFLSAQEKAAIYTEIKAQISRLLQHNIVPTHLDGHHHVHTEFGITGVYLSAAKEFGITKMRLSKNIGKTGYAKTIYKVLFNTYLQEIKKTTTTDFFCSATEFLGLMEKKQLKEGSSYEIMVHAKLNGDGTIVDIDHSNLGNKMSPIISRFNAISFYEIDNL